jgi:hypothetical protein
MISFEEIEEISFSHCMIFWLHLIFEPTLVSFFIIKYFYSKKFNEKNLMKNI